jgi:uncharacterized membrane protein
MSVTVMPSQTARVATRVQSVDILRGAIMIIMALDHVRDFFHSSAQEFQPTDLTRTTVALFFTRWITHFCAPVFMFTAGLSAFFWARNKTKPELSRFLWTRGLWLVFLELTLVQFALLLQFNYNPVILNVLWALGFSMIALGCLIYLPVGVLAFLSTAAIALHNFADKVNADQFGGFGPLWMILHQQSMFKLAGHTVIVAYPLIPWIGVMAAGYCAGQFFTLEPEHRRRLLVQLGLGMTVAFLIVRAINVYGDPARWSPQSSPIFTVLSFLNTAKYPPSLDFLLMTLGPALAVLGWIDRVTLSPANPLLVFGRTPLFYFLGHLLVAHAAAAACQVFIPGWKGFDLAGTYAVWIAVVTLMYPLCRWYGQVKQRKKSWWLSYL